MAIDVEADEKVKHPLAGFSIVDLIQHDLEEIVASSDVYIPIKGYESSGLAAHYVLPEGGKVLDAIAQKVMRETKEDYVRNLHISIDTMIHLCRGLYVKPEGVEDWVMLDPEETGEPVGFDARLAPLIKYEGEPRARAVVRKLFGNNDMALLNHFEKLSRWMVDTKSDLETEFWQMGGMR